MTKISLICPVCHTTFERYQSAIKHNKVTFCGPECRDRYYANTRRTRKKSEYIHIEAGTKIKNLSLIEYTKEGIRVFWRCRCDCGKEVVRREDYLQQLIRQNRTISCGCKNPTIKKGKESPTWKGCGKISAQFFHNVKKNAEVRNIDFNLTITDMWNLFLHQNETCTITGIKLEFSETKRTEGETTASLDRIDSTKGYELGNVHWVHKHINKMKMEFPLEYFIKFCHLVANNNPTESPPPLRVTSPSSGTDC